MSVIKQGKRRDRGFFTCDNRIVEDKDLTWEAKGILCYLLSKPESWTVRVNDLANQGPQGIYKIRAAIDLLCQKGYMVKSVKQDDKGRLDGWDYTVYEEPQEVSTVCGKIRIREKPVDGKNPHSVKSVDGENPHSVNCTHSNKGEYSNDLLLSNDLLDSKKDGAVLSGLQLRFGKLFRYTERRIWDASEKRAWKQAKAVAEQLTEDELLALETYYSASGSGVFKRSNLATLLNNLNGEVAKAKAYVEATQETDETPYREIVEIYNRTAGKVFSPATLHHAGRKEALRSFWNALRSDLPNVEAYFTQAARAKGLRASQASQNWRPNIDWLIRIENVTKIVEGVFK